MTSHTRTVPAAVADPSCLVLGQSSPRDQDRDWEQQLRVGITPIPSLARESHPFHPIPDFGIAPVPSLPRELFTRGSGRKFVSSGAWRCHTLGVPGWELPPSRMSWHSEDPGKAQTSPLSPEWMLLLFPSELLPKFVGFYPYLTQRRGS